MTTLAAQVEKCSSISTLQYLPQQVEQMLAATAEGKIAPDIAKRIIEAIAALETIRQVNDIEAHLKAMESH